MMFYFIIVVLSVFAAAFIVAPLLLRGEGSDQDRGTFNVELFRERVAELDQSDQEAANLEIEARQDLLADSREDSSSAAVSGAYRAWIWGAALLVPLLAMFIYLDVGLGRGAIIDFRLMGELKNLDISDQQAHAKMLADLGKRAARRPRDGELNFFLARSYQSLGRHDESLVIFQRLLNSFPNDAGLHSAYAEALFLGQDRTMTDEVRQAVDKALSMNPHDTSMLEVEGLAAIAEGRRDAALGWFRKALATGVTGQRAEMLRRAIASLEPGIPGADLVAAGRNLSIQVSTADTVAAADRALVFVYARAAAGPPAPLAVQRFPLSALPRTVVLNESMAMIEGMGLANFDEIVVIARISQTGDVVPKPGDYEARSAVIDMNAIPDQINLVITDPVDL